MGIIKHRCVCDICSCGRHHCGAVAANSTGKLDLAPHGDIYVASKAAFQFPDTLNLFEGAQDLTTIVKADFKGHDKLGVERRKPKDLIEIPDVKLSKETVTNVDFPHHHITADMYPAVQSAPDTLSTDKVKMRTETSYADHYAGKKGLLRDPVKIHSPEIKASTGALDLLSLNRQDYIATAYGRPHLNKIDDNNLFGVSEEDKVSKLTTARDHFPRLSQSPVQAIRREASTISLGGEDVAKNSTMRADYVRTAPKVRSSKKRGTTIDFGKELDHKTSYGTQFTGDASKREAAAKFKDELELFAGEQDLQTIVRADFVAPLKTGVLRHKPKDLIEIPSDKMSKETVTLGHYQAPEMIVVAPSLGKEKEGAGVKATFDVNQAIPSHKVDYNTSYANEYTKKKADKAVKASFKDEILPSQGALDLNSLAQVDYTKFKYGRPMIHKIPDNNVMGINYSLGGMGRKRVESAQLEVESMPSSRGSIRVGAGEVATKESAPDFAIGLEVESLPSSRGSIRVGAGEVATKESAPDFGITVEAEEVATKQSAPGAAAKEATTMRKSKRRGSQLSFGRGFYADTSYRDNFTSKQCLVPAIDKLDEYTFETIKGGHRMYKIDCGCPPLGSCGCPPPPAQIKA